MEVSGKRADIIKEGAAENQEELCEVCEVDHVTTKANGICRECEQFMCNTCFTTHIKVKSCRQHVLVDTNQSVSPVHGSAENVEKCKTHANETIKYYCRKHEKVGCGDCMIPVHGPCKPENIIELSKQFHKNEDYKSLMNKLQDLEDANDNNGKKILFNKKANTDMLEEALKEIKTFRTEINKYLDKAELSIAKEAKDIERDNNKTLAKLEQDCKLLSSKITEVRKKLDAEIYQDSALFIQTVDCKPRVLHIEREVSRIQSQNDIRALKFMPDKQLKGIITSALKLGSITNQVIKSQTKPDTTTRTKAESNKEAAGGKKYTDKKENEIRSATIVAAGARVRPVGNCSKYEHWIHQCQPGTVTVVNADGSVNVKWDATGRTISGYIIGSSVELV